MGNSYFFDKRKLKRNFIKYGIIFLISFVPLVLFNIYVGALLESQALVIFLDCVILLVFVTIGNHFLNKYFAKKDAKKDARIRERELLKERKKLILEESYMKKRQEKLEKKTIKKEEDSPDINQSMDVTKKTVASKKSSSIKKSTSKSTQAKKKTTKNTNSKNENK